MEYYRTFIRTRKWTLRCILHFSDLGLTNSWMEYRNDCLRAKLPKNEIFDFCIVSAKPRHDTSDSSSEDEPPSNRSNWGALLPTADKRTDRYDH